VTSPSSAVAFSAPQHSPKQAVQALGQLLVALPTGFSCAGAWNDFGFSPGSPSVPFHWMLPTPSYNQWRLMQVAPQWMAQTPGIYRLPRPAMKPLRRRSEKAIQSADSLGKTAWCKQQPVSRATSASTLFSTYKVHTSRTGLMPIANQRSSFCSSQSWGQRLLGDVDSLQQQQNQHPKHNRVRLDNGRPILPPRLSVWPPAASSRTQ
jgi:hypothetical protein